jgi:hypothetical protein
VRVWYAAAFAVLLLVTIAQSGAADPEADRESTGRFYRGLPYGSDAAFNPFSELVNGAFGILQISSNWRTLDEIDWRNGLDVTWRSISHPASTVDAYGWRNFMTSEVLPGEIRWRGLQYIPNYHLHLIGGGARHRAFVEWYGANGFAHPAIWAAMTTIVHSFAVEAVEHEAAHRATVDPVADMLVFDPAGVLLFSSDRVSDFFSRTLHMSIWSGQPMYNPVANSIENAGQNYSLHYFFSKDHNVGIFQYWGMSDLFGLTVRGASGLDWSVGVGGVVSELREEQRGMDSSAFYARIKWDVGAFLHREGSLLASVHVSESWTQRFRFNLFPGVVAWRGLSPGVYLGVRDEDVILGLSFVAVPLGLAVSQ